jgi:hypothetical protein
MKKLFLICVGLLFCTTVFAKEIRLSFSKPFDGNSSEVYVNGHTIIFCNNMYWDNKTKDSWIKFYLDEDRKRKVTFDKPLRGFEWYASTPTKEKMKNYDRRRAAFLDLESFTFYEDDNIYIIEIY